MIVFSVNSESAVEKSEVSRLVDTSSVLQTKTHQTDPNLWQMLKLAGGAPLRWEMDEGSLQSGEVGPKRLKAEGDRTKIENKYFTFEGNHQRLEFSFILFFRWKASQRYIYIYFLSDKLDLYLLDLYPV